MRPMHLAIGFLFISTLAASAGDGNRLAYLQENDPYYVSGRFPKLITPQWIGEPGVDAVIVLAIDDMKGHPKWEAYLRPILDRLKKIDGRAPVSIMTCQIDPKEPHLQEWLKEGVSLETHTLDHPCPFFRGGFEKAKATYEQAVDLLADVPNSRPVAFRMPCCDSLNTPSPRFYAEIFNKKSTKGNFLSIDSSVFNVFTADDPELPRELVLDSRGQERFRKYLPLDGSFANTIENYPYPYVMGGLCWQFPCATPSDWQAQNILKPFNPIMVQDMKASIDCTVAKKGVFSFVFHPHGWIKNTQVVELIDHVVEKYGKKVKFLTFREALERLNKNLLAGQPLRHPKTGKDNGVRLLDLNDDGYLDVVVANGEMTHAAYWSPQGGSQSIDGLPRGLLAEDSVFGVFRVDGKASLIVVRSNDKTHGVYHFDGVRFVADQKMSTNLLWLDAVEGLIQLRDLDGDGRCELIGPDSSVNRWSPPAEKWDEAPYRFPRLSKWAPGADDGIRFIDLDGDGRDDVVFSNQDQYGIYLFKDTKTGWSRKLMGGKAGEPGSLPPIAINGMNQGFWVHAKQLIWGNENTAARKDHVDRRTFAELLKDVQPGPKSPQQSLKLLQPRPGFVAELTATEPLVMDPIAFAWGADGKLWVVEMGDYPLGIDGKGKFGGVVRFLEDLNGDGVYDKSTVFLSDLGYPTGIVPWGRGVIVSGAPDIFYAEDTDGDGKADKREVLYTGFKEGNQQHRVNGLVRGLDNWLYLANGDSGGTVKSAKTGKVVNISGRDLRILPETGDLEAISGQTQFGRNRDDWGNWFGGNNANPIWHYVLADEYLRRNPHVAPPLPRVSVPAVPGAAPVFPRSVTLMRFNDYHTANRFTSACSPIVYRDDLFGPAFTNNAFISEPVHNLVHREIMKADGVTFTSRRADDEQISEFLASADSWFRPTMIQTGPDGALWVSDMYRHVIEHPQWIPKDWQQKLDLRAGHDLGRLYRVFPADKKPRPIPNLAKLTGAQLVAALNSPSGWQRDTAQYLLVSRGDKAVTPLLTNLIAGGERPLARLHALCALDGLLPATGPAEHEMFAALKIALGDSHPGVRKHAVRISEARFAKEKELGPLVAKLAGDADPQVRQQVAYSLGAWDDPRAGEVLGSLAVRDGGDRYISASVMSSVNARNIDATLRAVLKQRPAAASPVFDGLLRTANGLGQNSAIATLLRSIATPDAGTYAPWQYAGLAGLLESLEQRNQSLVNLQKVGDAKVQAALSDLSGLFKTARARAADGKSAVADRVEAIRLLGGGLDAQEADRNLLVKLLLPQSPEVVQKAALANLGRQRHPQVPELILAGWKSYTPSLRAQAMDALLSRDDWTTKALVAAEKKTIIPSEVDAARRQRLLDHKSADVRARAAKLFATSISQDRRKVLEEYATALALKGDAARGQPHFSKLCSACHRLGGAGNDVGPDLSVVWDKSADWLLTSILDPNQAVEARYVNYVVSLKSGSVMTGLLTNETATSVTVVGADGQPKTILRADLDELASTGKSAMPEGLEKDLQPKDVSDLLAFIRSNAAMPKPKVMEGNTPALVRPNPDGSMLAHASACEIRGKALIFEKKYGNLGNWHGEDDSASWTLTVPRAGKYAVTLDYACDTASAGNTFSLESGAARLAGRVDSTGSWDTYRQVRIGSLEFATGEQRLVLRSAGPIRGALIDLKAIRLVPESTP